MNNTIEFVLRMRDMMSSNITKVSSTSQSAFNKMKQSADNMTGRNKVLGMSFNELQSKIKDVENTISKSTVPSQIRAARRELEALQRQSNKHAGNPLTQKREKGSGIGIGGIALGSMVGNLAFGGLTAVAGAVGAGVSSMITKSMEKEQAITGLSTFLGKKGATEAYKNIRSDADATPYDTASLLEVNRALISAGLNAKDSRKDTMNLANAVSAVGGGNDVLSRMAANMQQIKTVGKATAMDIRQFGIAGINVYEMLARSTGKNISEVKEMDVSYEELAKSFEMAGAKGGIYEGALAAQSQTMAGKWSTVKDKAANALSDIGDAFSPIIIKMLDLGIKFSEWISSGLVKAMPYIEAFSNFIGKGVDYIMQMVNGTSEWSGWIDVLKSNFLIIWEFTKKLAIKLWQFVSSIVQFIKNSQILKDLFRAIGWIIGKVGDLIIWVVDSILWLWENVLKPILNALDWVYKKLTGRGTDVKVTHTINPPKKPYDKPAPTPSPLGTGGALATTNEASGKEVGETVAGAGPKVVNIHVGKFFDNLQFTTMNTGETVTEIEKVVMECLARVVYNGSKLV